MKCKEKLSFVIPCYGSENTIEFVIDEIVKTVELKEEYEYEIITVNDQSPDNVITVLKKIAQNNKNVKVIDLAKNFGKHSAVMAGLSVAKGNYIINIDDDGQCPMDRLWDLLDPLLNGTADYVMAEYKQLKQSLFKNIGSAVNTLMSRILLDKPKNLHFSNFTAMKRYIVDEILRYNNPYPYFEGLLLRTTRNIATVPMEERDRYAGQGNFTFRKSLSLWLNGFTAFSVKPLRISSLIGCLCALFGFVFGIVTIIRKLLIPDISAGWSSTISILLFIGGLIMLMLGMIGEYIGRIYISINNSPQYVIRDTINLDNEE